MGTITRRLAAALAAAGILVTVGCASTETVDTSSSTAPVTASSDAGTGTTVADDDTDQDQDQDQGSGDYAEACSLIEQIDELESDGDLDQGLTLFADARDAGPDELADHWDKLAEVFEQLSTVDENDPAAVKDMLELMDDQEFLDAAAAIDDFAEEECGLDIGLDPAEDSGGTGGLTDDPELIDPAEDPTSVKNVKGYLAGTYGDEAWWPVLEDATAWGSSGTPNRVTWTVTLSGKAASKALPVTELVAACDAMADYLDDYETADVSIKISDIDDNVLVSRDAGEACAAA